MNLLRYGRVCVLGVLLTGLGAASSALAATRIAVLDFELNDLTGITPIPREDLERTASLAPLLRAELGKKGYELVEISQAEQAKANSGFGYLYDRPDEAARFGSRLGADIVVVGVIHKPSFLFAYLKVRLANASRAVALGEHIVEIKGSAATVTGRGIAQLARQIDTMVQQDKPGE